MPPMSDTERQKLLLQQEIAKLSGAISRHATNQSSHANSYHPYRGYSARGGSRGGYASRARGRGRGRGGGSYGLDLRSVNRAAGASSLTSAAGPSGSTAATGTNTASGEKEDGEVSPPPQSAALPSTSADKSEGWIKKTSRGGNMSLMTVHKRNQLASRPPPAPKPKVHVPPHIEVLHSTTDSSPGGTEGKRVVIDGVIFQFEQGGSKLTRIGEVSTGPSPAQGTPTRQSLRYGGEQYRRTKRGNLISRSSLSQRRAEQASKPCRYFTKTGRCDRALTCPYKHDPDRIAICPRFLRGACPLGAGACPLSHTPSAHNTPSCVHFQATATCRNGDSCLYPHVRVSEDAPVCEAFAREGWCDREAGTCPELHIWECPEWHAKGTCARGTRCGLRHVLRRKGKATETHTPAITQDTQGEGGFEDQSEYIGLPGEVISDTSDSEEEEDDDEDDGDDDEDEDEGDDDGDEGDDDEEEGDEEEEGNEETEDVGDDDAKDEAMAVDEDEDSGKLPPSSPGIRTDDDDELRVLGEL